MLDSSHIITKDLTKVFEEKNNKTIAFDALSVDIPRGQFCALIGPSGCGKSSFLRTLAGLETASEGTLNISSVDNNHRIGMIFQEVDLFPWMTLQRNIEFFLDNNPRVTKSEIADIARQFLHRVGLEDFSDYLPGRVSGGMQQRASIARCFANDADLLLMDEPFVYLDYQSRIRLHQILLDVWRDSGKTVVFVTHDIEEAVFLADRVLVMSAHPGQIIEDIKMEFPRPRDLKLLRKEDGYINLVNHLSELIIHSEKVP